MTTKAERAAELMQRPELQDFEGTVLRPLPTFPCTHTARSTGEPCKNMGVMGMLPDKARCASHGGKKPGISEKAMARVEAARLKIYGSAEQAADVLEALLDPGTSEGVRLKAATEVLDRAGIRAGFELDVGGEIQVNHADAVRKKLVKLALGTTVFNDEDETIQEAEIVEETPDE